MFDDVSPVQRRMYEYILECQLRDSLTPTMREIGASLGKASTSNVDYHLNALEEKGYLTRAHGRSRSIRLLRLPERGLPILGTIAAGTPISLFLEPELAHLSLDFPDSHMASGLYALRVKGDSMVDDMIADGDLVVIDSAQKDPYDGAIVVATDLNGDGEAGAATLKRFYHEGRRIRLQPANANYAPIYIDAAEWKRGWTVQGTVRAVIRSW
ncbi:MAG: transcriptional repressor LexA [Ktedonobacterales bacterium]